MTQFFIFQLSHAFSWVSQIWINSLQNHSWEEHNWSDYCMSMKEDVKKCKKMFQMELSESANDRATSNPSFLGQNKVYELLNSPTAGTLKTRKIEWEVLSSLNGWGNEKLCRNVCFKRASASFWLSWAELDHAFSLSMKHEHHMWYGKISSLQR